MASKRIVCIVGSGNWGSVIAKIVGTNILKDDRFENRVNMYVYEEMIGGRKLTDIINTQHENIKYMPGCILPSNVIATPDIVQTVNNADYIVFVLPHQFMRNICSQIQGKVKKSAIGISLIKGLDVSDGYLDLISNVIRKMLRIECAVLMGANLAPEVANENYCEATIGCKNEEAGLTLKQLFQTPYFRIVVVKDEYTVELCGALKNIVALGTGFVDGLHYGDNTKAAVIRLGLMEIVEFCRRFSPETQTETFLESCGVADLITTCYRGRNRRVAEAFVLAEGSKTIEQLEEEMLNGQKLQGPPTAAEVFAVLKNKKLEDNSETDSLDRFPLFVAIHRICIGELPASSFIDCLKNHPEHM